MKTEIQKAILDGLAIPRETQRFGGCCRAYVCLTDKTLKKDFKAGAKLAGAMYLDKAYGTGNMALYIGYDNSNSLNMSKAIQIAENLKAIGVGAYWDVVGD